MFSGKKRAFEPNISIWITVFWALVTFFCSGNDFEEGNHLYRFLEHEPFIPRCFNFRGTTNDTEPKTADSICARLTKIMSAILESYASDDRQHVDYEAISRSEEFRRYGSTNVMFLVFYCFFCCIMWMQMLFKYVHLLIDYNFVIESTVKSAMPTVHSFTVAPSLVFQFFSPFIINIWLLSRVIILLILLLTAGM